MKWYMREHYVIGQERKSANHAVVQVSGFDIEAYENRMMLIRDPSIAQMAGVKCHKGYLLSSYTNGLLRYLDGLQHSDNFIAAQSGNISAKERLFEEVRLLSNAMNVAIGKGDLIPYQDDRGGT